MTNYRRLFKPDGYIFITIVTFNRKPILINNIDIFRQSFKNVQKIYNFVIFAISVMPDHLHMLIKPEKNEQYPKIISSIKHNFSRNINMIDGQVCPSYGNTKNLNKTSSRLKKREKEIWQRRYWEHTIKDEEDLYLHFDYIHYNPVKHGYVEKVKEWVYSTFHKFVKQEYYKGDWGSFNDVKKILDIVVE